MSKATEYADEVIRENYGYADALALGADDEAGLVVDLDEPMEGTVRYRDLRNWLIGAFERGYSAGVTAATATAE
jgi:hypothetical protein